MLTLSAYAQIYSTRSAHAEVHGTASVAPDYTGVSDKLLGKINLDNNYLRFQIPLESLKTGNSRRDRHMYEALEVSEYPYADFSGKLEGYDKDKPGRQQVVVDGVFTIHGQSKELRIPGTLEKTGEGLRFAASFPVYITNYGIEKPKVLFAEVDDKHEIEVNGVVTEDKGA